MPWQRVMDKYKSGELHSGSKQGPKVRSRKQAIAIMLAEKREGEGTPRKQRNRRIADEIARHTR